MEGFQWRFLPAGQAIQKEKRKDKTYLIEKKKNLDTFPSLIAVATLSLDGLIEGVLFSKFSSKTRKARGSLRASNPETRLGFDLNLNKNFNHQLFRKKKKENQPRIFQNFLF